MSNLLNAFTIESHHVTDIAATSIRLLDHIKSQNYFGDYEYEDTITYFENILSKISDKKNLKFDTFRQFTMSFRKNIRPIILENFMKRYLIYIQEKGEEELNYEEKELNDTSQRFLESLDNNASAILQKAAKINNKNATWEFIKKFYKDFYKLDQLTFQYFPASFEEPHFNTIQLLTVHHNDVSQVFETNSSIFKGKATLSENMKEQIAELCGMDHIDDNSDDDVNINARIKPKEIKKEIEALKTNIAKENAKLETLKEENNNKLSIIEQIQNDIRDIKNRGSKNSGKIEDYYDQCNFLIQYLYILRTNSVINKLDAFKDYCKDDDDCIIDEFINKIE